MVNNFFIFNKWLEQIGIKKYITRFIMIKLIFIRSLCKKRVFVKKKNNDKIISSFILRYIFIKYYLMQQISYKLFKMITSRNVFSVINKISIFDINHKF